MKHENPELKTLISKPRTLNLNHFPKTLDHAISDPQTLNRPHTPTPTPHTAGSSYMTRDDDGNVLSTEYGLCEYADSQGIHLQVRTPRVVTPELFMLNRTAVQVPNLNPERGSRRCQSIRRWGSPEPEPGTRVQNQEMPECLKSRS